MMELIVTAGLEDWVLQPSGADSMTTCYVTKDLWIGVY